MTMVLRKSSLLACVWMLRWCRTAIAAVAAFAQVPSTSNTAGLFASKYSEPTPQQQPIKPTTTSHGPILVVGATGGTGLRALQGLLDAGINPSQIRLMTRNPQKLQALQNKLGLQVVRGDLEDQAELADAVRDCVGVYVHAVAGDTRKVTLGASDRAATLRRALERHASPSCHLVFNSAAGEAGHGVERIQQMHEAEQEFAKIPFTSLRANLFLEELWKRYTRPAIFKGKFPFSVPSDRRIYLTSVRDMGRIAGTCLLESSHRGELINVAGDVLTAQELASTFAEAQDAPCQHSPGRVFAIFCRLFFRDLYQIIRFYRRSTETTDIDALQSEFPTVPLTDLKSFLNETDWGNRELVYENFTDPERLYLP